MEIAKKAIVSCELVEGRMKTEIKGGLEDILSLTTYLLVNAATCAAKAGVIGLDEPKEIIAAMYGAAIDALKEQKE